VPDSFRIGEFHVEPSLYRVSGPAGTVRLEPKVMHVLVCLTEHSDRVVSKERLLRAVWPDTFVTDDVLTRAISELRRVLGDDVKHPRLIETIPKSGYRLMSPVSFNSADVNAAAAEAMGGETSPDHSLAGPRGSESQRVRSRARFLSWAGAVAAGASVVAVSVMVLVSQRMNLPPSGRVVHSGQLTFTGRVATAVRETDFFPAIATDGGRVYFTQYIDGTRLALGQASLGGGEVVSIPTPLKQAYLVNVSPDGSRLLVREWEHARLEDPLWVIPTVGGAALRLGSIVAHDAAWSPDGNRLVFARDEWLYVARSDGSEPRKLVTTPGRAFWVRWSPDGTRLRFTIVDRQRQSRSIWEVSAEGHDLRPVPLKGRVDMDCCGDWSADGRQFFFLRYRDERVAIWAIRERSSLFDWTAAEPVPLTSGPLHFVAVVPARHGRQLLGVGVQERGVNLRFDQRTRQYEPYNAGGWAQWFSASRDGQWMAYFGTRARDSGLWRSRADGSDRLQLTQPRLQVLLPRWSPDGTRIAFMGRTPGGPWKIYVIPAQGGEAIPVHGDERAQSDPDWSPDGELLMFGRPPDYLAEPRVPKAIHLVNLKTKEVSMLPGSEGLFGSRWSPSGRYVAAVTLDQTNLLLFDFSTRTWAELGRFKIVHNPSWSRDERFLYFEVADEVGIYRMRMSDRAVERVADLRGVWTSDTNSCSFEGLAADDSPLILCFRADRDIYALGWELR
jgi:DNA-binding winged helix-turn-helix (wHTH) protein/Tol biopolymer transport system component